jgi:xylulokinase
MPKFLLAHDLGTSGNKATLFTTDGKLVKNAVSAYETRYYNSNWAEQNPDDWWRAVCTSTKQLLEGINSGDILAVSFSGQMMGCLCVDKGGIPLYPSIIWADMRAAREEAYLRSQIDPAVFYKTVGHRISSSYSLEKLMWIRNNEADVYKQTYKMLNAKDYIVYKMTGRFVTDYSDASGTNAFDINTFGWSEKILDASGIDAEKLPEAMQSTTVVGEISAEVADECGLKKGTKVVLGGGDGMCASVGAGSVSEGVTYNCLGSSSWICTTTKQPIFDDQMRTFNWAHIVPGYVGPCGTMQTAGAAFSWAKNEMCRLEQKEAAVSGKSPYEIINEEIEKSSPTANGLIFLPYLLGERSPRWNPEAKGAFIGLKMEHSHNDMLRSVVEGIAMNLNVILSVLRRQIDVKEMIVIGGMAMGKVQRQILADVFGLNVLKLNFIEEATSMGAAVTAGVGVGELAGFDEINRFIRVEEVLKPVAGNVEKYKRIIPIFEDAYHALEGVYSRLAESNAFANEQL